jgi:hypothetical protein
MLFEKIFNLLVINISLMMAINQSNSIPLIFNLIEYLFILFLISTILFIKVTHYAYNQFYQLRDSWQQFNKILEKFHNLTHYWNSAMINKQRKILHWKWSNFAQILKRNFNMIWHQRILGIKHRSRRLKM